jgi:type I restriction enzyme M protein
LTALSPKSTDIDSRWSNGDPVIYFMRRKGSDRTATQSTVTKLRATALPPGTNRLRYTDLEPAPDVTGLFGQLDDLLHRSGHIKEERHTILLKLLLVKLFDEERGQDDNSVYLLIQDFSAMALAWDTTIERIFTDALEQALVHYNGILAPEASRSVGCSAQVLREISARLCKIRLLRTLPQIIQDLFMYFGRFHYRLDMGQYFTPSEVIRLIAAIVNPGINDRVVDPACGTADFLVGAKQVAEQTHGKDISANLQGYDIAPLAVQLSIFNMLLNGDRGLADLQTMDTLEHALEYEGRYDIALCNPPFGARIVERRPKALQRFSLVNTQKLRAQEAGLLYVEMCVNAVAPGGRIGILVPNGYLSNRSDRYLGFRRYLLLNVRVAAVIGFPRFTFKKSGADVSASALILERRAQPLNSLDEMDDHPIHFNLIEKLGWDLQSKSATRLYKRDPLDGTEIQDDSGERIPDSDFESALREVLSSEVADTFDWMDKSARQAGATGGWTVPASQIAARADLSLDPKRWSRKHVETRTAVRNVPHIEIGQVIRPVTRNLKKNKLAVYRYVEIEKIREEFGAYVADPYRGWELPGRARLVAAPGDIFIANIWSSAGKWMIAGDDASDGQLVVTTGCSHFEVIPGREALLPDLVFGLCSEAFKVQMRANATGSDGLSNISVADIRSISLPRMQSTDVREKLERQIRDARAGRLILPNLVRDELARVAPETNIPLRSSHAVQV